MSWLHCVYQIFTGARIVMILKCLWSTCVVTWFSPWESNGTRSFGDRAVSPLSGHLRPRRTATMGMAGLAFRQQWGP